MTKMDDKGFSLIELLIAMAISTIIIASVGQAMVMAMRQYSMSNNEATVQERAQIVMNILHDELIDSMVVPVSKDGKSLDIIQGNNRIMIYLEADPDEEGTYLLKYSRQTGDAAKEIETLSKGVKSFACSLNDNGSAVNIELELKDLNRSYKTSSTIYMRNYQSDSYQDSLEDVS